MIRTYIPNGSGSIRMKMNFSDSFGFIRIDRIHWDWKFELIGLTRFIWIESSDWSGFIPIGRIHSICKFGLILNGPRIDSDWRLTSDYINKIRINHNWSELTFRMNSAIRINPISPNENEFFFVIWIYSERQDSFGLKVRIKSDWADLFGLQVWIDFEWASDWFGLKTNLGLDRNETVCCG